MRGRAAEYEAVLGLLASTGECRGKVLLVEGDPDRALYHPPIG
jgi:hypothetical protein